MHTPLTPTDFSTESDVEQKIVWPLLTGAKPHGLGLPEAEIFTKPNIREFQIGKGTTTKRYYPDYIATILGLPVLIVEAKAPGEDLGSAAAEARLYATELNARYPSDINPCKFCVVTDGLVTQLRTWDSDTIVAEFPLEDISPVSPSFGQFTRLLAVEALHSHATQIHAAIKPAKHFRALTLIGGYTVQSEQIANNDFGRVLAANFQTLFDPASYADRVKIVRNAYVGSPRKERYIGEIDRVIRNSSPTLISGAPVISDSAHPTEVIQHFQDLPSLRNKILLLVGSVGAGKSTFVDYLRECALSDEIQQHLAWVRIDLNPAPITATEIYPWLRQQIIHGIRATSSDIDTFTLENLKKVYRQQLREFDLGEGALFEKNSQEYSARLADLLSQSKQDEVLTIRSLEQHLCTGRGRLLIVVLDNCDKRDRDQQLLMFQVATYVQQEVRCLIILPLRYETFENHRHEPPLDTALKDLVYRIEPPSFHEVLRTRLGLVLSEAKEMGPKSLSYHFDGKTIMLPVDKLERYLHAMMGALFDHKQYGRKIIIGLAGWNIRKAFEIFLEFCRSGFIEEADIFERQVGAGGDVGLPHGVVAKVLLRTNRRYYDGDHSFVKNIFQTDPAWAKPSLFLRYWILAWLRAKGGVNGPSGVKGYHRQGDLVRDLLSIGADPDAIRSECRYLAKAGCILPEHLRADSIADSDLIAMTPAGHVHLELAHRDVNYHAACAEDSWLTSVEVAEAIQNRITEQPYWRALSWRNTLANAADFCAYLKHAQDRSLKGVPYLPDASGEPARIDFDKILDEIDAHQQRRASGSGSQLSLRRLDGPRDE